MAFNMARSKHFWNILWPNRVNVGHDAWQTKVGNGGYSTTLQGGKGGQLLKHGAVATADWQGLAQRHS